MVCTLCHCTFILTLRLLLYVSVILIVKKHRKENIADKTCLFCGENETIHYLFFDCCVAVETWNFCADILNTQGAHSFEVVARWWISNKKHTVLNMCTSAFLWSLWKLRNNICFQGVIWSDVRTVVRKASRMLKRWKSLCKEAEELRLRDIVEELDRRAAQPLRIGWTVLDSQAVPEAQTLAERGAGVSSDFGVSMEPEAAAQDVFLFCLRWHS